MPFCGFCGQIDSSIRRLRARRSFMQFKAPWRDASVECLRTFHQARPIPSAVPGLPRTSHFSFAEKEFSK
jgi:hypothetical protein